MKPIHLFIILLIGGCGACTREADPSLHETLRDMAELTLAEVRIEKTFVIDDPDIHFREIGSRQGVFTDAVDWFRRKTSFGQRIGVYSFGTYFVAAMDLTQLTAADVAIDRRARRCTVYLPPITVSERGRDFDLRIEHERIAIYRARLTPDERARAKDEASRLLAAEMAVGAPLHTELIRKAEIKARTYFVALLAEQGYTADIHVKKQ